MTLRAISSAAPSEARNSDHVTERVVLAFALGTSTATGWADALNDLTPDLFSYPAHQRILLAAVSLSDKGQQVSVTAVRAALAGEPIAREALVQVEGLRLGNREKFSELVARLRELERARAVRHAGVLASTLASEGDVDEASRALELGLDAASSTAAWPEPILFGRKEAAPFPTAALPPWIGEFVREVARQTQTPEDMAATFALGALATLAGGRVRIEAWEGWTEGANLFLAVVMGPGNLKSPVFKRMIEPIEQLEEALQEGARPRVADQKMKLQIAEKRAGMLRDRAGKCEDPAERAQLEREAADAQREVDSMPPATLPRLICGDVTPEQLVTLLVEQGEKIAMLSAESSLFGHLSGRYSDAPAIEVFLSGHAGDRVHVDRRGRAEVLRRPALTVAIAVQPGVVAKAVANETLRDRGLLARFLFAAPSSRVGWRDLSCVPDEVPALVARAYRDKMTVIGANMLSLTEPALLALSREARDAFVAWRAETEPRRRARGKLGGVDVEGWAAKLDGVVLRLAALLHVASNRLRDPVAVGTLRAAITIAEFFTEHSMAVLGEVEVDTERTYQDVVAWLAERSERVFSRRDVHVVFRGRREMRTSAGVEAVLVRIAEHGFIRRVERTDTRPGRPSEKWIAHPSIRELCAGRAHAQNSAPASGHRA